MKTAIGIGQITAGQIIDILGGTFAVAKILNIKPPSVSDWRSAGNIPDDKLVRLAVKIEEVTNSAITRQILFPDDWETIWPELSVDSQVTAECACQS
ncbi:hypothetical protein Nit79A3_2423 [Nitrosomonas sp. Is79A3]|uniref:Cro/CI family transcriptional regulator n=1 Tax=Nitrosomonas sp. (strain Is79A3) TaxID=261292 RepID=UPI000215CAD6